jgi:hypothetical protein
MEHCSLWQCYRTQPSDPLRTALSSGTLLLAEGDQQLHKRLQGSVQRSKFSWCKPIVASNYESTVSVAYDKAVIDKYAPATNKIHGWLLLAVKCRYLVLSLDLQQSNV